MTICTESMSIPLAATFVHTITSALPSLNVSKANSLYDYCLDPCNETAEIFVSFFMYFSRISVSNF
jgi:hypothetical protein